MQYIDFYLHTLLLGFWGKKTSLTQEKLYEHKEMLIHSKRLKCMNSLTTVAMTAGLLHRLL